jgi:hypothetical protein
MDIVGPFKPSKSGNKYIITAVDHFTKHLEAEAVEDIEATTVNEFTLNHFYFRHGSPEILFTDNGKQLNVAHLNQLILNSLGSVLKNSTPYHPQANGQVERVNGILKDIISKYSNASGSEDWDNFLSLAVFSYNTSVHSLTGFTPFYLLHGREARSLFDNNLPDITLPKDLNKKHIDYAKELVERLKSANGMTKEHIHNRLSLYNKPKVVLESLQLSRDKLFNVKPRFNINDLVYVYTPVIRDNKIKKLATFWEGPYRILRVINALVFEVLIKNKPSLIHVARLKPCYVRRSSRTRSMSQPTIIDNNINQIIVDCNINDLYD